MEPRRIVGMSAGRKGKTSEAAVSLVLASSGLESEIFSLSDLDLLTCDACNGCVDTHICVKDDGLVQIQEAMERADAIVFGAPQYWGGMCGKGRAFWERVCFSGRHNSLFPLSGTPGVIIGVSGTGTSTHVVQDIKRFFDDARIHTVDQVEVQGEFACFTCGYGDKCSVGGYAGMYPLGTPITSERTPTLCNQRPETGRGFSVRGRLEAAGRGLGDPLALD